MERARTGDRPGPFFERRLSRIVGEAAATFLKVDQFSKTSALARFDFGGVGNDEPSGWRIIARQRGYHVGDIGALVLEPLLLRSEEHTSELQSLMRISYAVFCLKKKKH